MQIETFSLGPMATNCYLAWCEATQQAVAIDPADEGGFISQKILELELELVAIILTHGHLDHILGLLELKLNFPQTPIMMHRADLFLLESVQQRAQHWLQRAVDPAPTPDKFITEGDEIKFGQETLRVIHTPGHTPGSICLYNDEVVFSGDTLLTHGIGRADFSYSEPKKMTRSLRKIRVLARDKELLSGHES